MYDISAEDERTVIKIHSARGYNLIGPEGTDGTIQTVSLTPHGIKLTTADTSPVPAPTFVAGFVRRLVNRVGATIDSQPYDCTIEPVAVKPYDCKVTLPLITDELQMERLRRFLDEEDAR